jgi:glycosyltransferase involved in cell wall biosynthesis
MSERPANPLISLVVPCYDEEEAIGPFFAAADEKLAGLNLEFVFVDDGSRDATAALIKARAGQDPRVKLVVLARNFGKEPALSAGLDHCTGEVVIPMDVDLQDPLEMIAVFLEKWRDGFDVVYGVRDDRSTDGALKRGFALGFYRVFNRISHDKIPENAGDFRLMDRRVVETLKALPERVRFMKGLFAWVGFRQVGVGYVRPPRSAGETKFRFWRLWQLALDGIFGFSSLPLKVWSYVGLAVSGLAILFAIFIVGRTLILGIDTPGYASLMTMVLLLGGLQLFGMGVLGEYLARVYTEVKGRPLYLIDYVFDGEKEAAKKTVRRAKPSRHH